MGFGPGGNTQPTAARPHHSRQLPACEGERGEMTEENHSDS